jgi:hypothetical protein
MGQSKDIGPRLRILMSGKLNLNQMVTLAEDVNLIEFWEATVTAIKWGDLAPEELLETARRIDRKEVWEKFIRFTQWDQLNVTKMLEIGDKVDNESVWIHILKSGKLTVEECLAIGYKRKTGKNIIWAKIADAIEAPVAEKPSE